MDKGKMKFIEAIVCRLARDKNVSDMYVLNNGKCTVKINPDWKPPKTNDSKQTIDQR